MTTALDVPQDERDTPQARLRSSEDTQVEPQSIGVIYKAAIATHIESILPRDMVQITPHFIDSAGTSSPAQICTQIANAWSSYLRAPSISGTVRLYVEDFNPGAPHNPVASADYGTPGGFLAGKGPGETALCLSYYAGQNTKRYRGRLYLPNAVVAQRQTTPPGSPGVRPTAGDRNAAMEVATVVFAPLLLNGWKWCVASTVDKVHRLVTNYWCNDEWDTIRSRGLRETARSTATFS